MRSQVAFGSPSTPELKKKTLYIVAFVKIYGERR